MTICLGVGGSLSLSLMACLDFLRGYPVDPNKKDRKCFPYD